MHRPDDLNVYVPLLQRAAGAAYFFRKMRGAAVPSSALMAPMTQRFVDAIKSFAARNGIDAYFGGSGTPISAEVEHRFRRKWNSDSGKWNTDFGMWNIHSGGSGTLVPES